MKYTKYYLVAVALLVAVAPSYGDILSAPADVNPERSIGLANTLLCLLRGNDSLCVMEGVYTAAKNWLKTAPEFKAQAMAELRGDGEGGILDYAGEVVTSRIDDVLKHYIVNDTDTSVDEGRSGYPGVTLTNAVVPVGTQTFGGYSSRVSGVKSKKKFLLKFYVLAKLFIFGFIAKAKIALIMFKIIILVKLKFLALAVIHTLIAFAKLHMQTKSPIVPHQTMGYNGYDHQHAGNYHQQDYGHGGAFGGVGAGGLAHDGVHRYGRIGHK